MLVPRSGSSPSLLLFYQSLQGVNKLSEVGHKHSSVPKQTQKNIWSYLTVVCSHNSWSTSMPRIYLEMGDT